MSVVVVGVDDDQGRRSKQQSGPLTQDVRHLAEDVSHRDAGVEQRRDHAAKECHVGGCGQAVSGDVADDERQSLIAEQDSLVPVTSHRSRLAGGQIPGGRLDPGHDRESPQQTRREVDDELVVSVVALRPFDRRCAQLGNGVQRTLQLGVEPDGTRPGEADRSDQAATVAVQRERCGCLDTGGDGVGDDLGESVSVGVEVRQQDRCPGTSSDGDRKRRAPTVRPCTGRRSPGRGTRHGRAATTVRSRPRTPGSNSRRRHTPQPATRRTERLLGPSPAAATTQTPEEAPRYPPAGAERCQARLVISTWPTIHKQVRPCGPQAPVDRQLSQARSQFVADNRLPAGRAEAPAPVVMRPHHRPARGPPSVGNWHPRGHSRAWSATRASSSRSQVRISRRGVFATTNPGSAAAAPATAHAPTLRARRGRSLPVRALSTRRAAAHLEDAANPDWT